jgi:prepilin-type N-terminal cleavage/methylation domain-containing protein
MRHNDERGFTLIEILVALIIAGIGLAALMGLTSSGLRMSTASDRVARETSLARSALERFGADLPIEAGIMTGEMSEGFRWRSEIQLMDAKTPAELIQPAIVSVTVWDGHEDDPGVRLTTLRLLPLIQPDGRRQ